MSAGIMSGVNWMRENFDSIAALRHRTSIVLPRPGTPSSRTWPPASSAVMTPSMTSVWPTIIWLMRFLMSAWTARKRDAASRASLADVGVMTTFRGLLLASDLREVLLDQVLHPRREQRMVD